MKKHLCIITGLLFISYYPVLAQRTTKAASSPVHTISQQDLDKNPFAKGKWEFAVAGQEVGYGHQNITENGIHQGHQSQFALDLGVNYYLANHIGIGLQLSNNVNTVDNINYKSSSDQWMSYANLTYGNTLGGNVNFYVRAGVGLGTNTSKYTGINNSFFTDKSNLFGYKLGLGFPIRLGNEPVYLTPQIGYHYLHDKLNGAVETDKHFDCSLGFEAYLFCHELHCDGHQRFNFSQHLYDAGHSYLGVSTQGQLDFGNNKTVNNNNFPDYKQTYSTQDISASYRYYFIKDLAVGVNINFGNSRYTTSNYTQHDISYTFEPMVEINLPVQQPGWNNLFLMGGYGFGGKRSDYTANNITSTGKFSTTNFCVGLGYNFLFTKSLSFTPIFQYASSTTKNKTTDTKDQYTGPQLGLGIRKFFGR